MPIDESEESSGSYDKFPKQLLIFRYQQINQERRTLFKTMLGDSLYLKQVPIDESGEGSGSYGKSPKQ